MADREFVHLFVCPNGRMLPRWSEAFRDARAGKSKTPRARSDASRIDVVWLRLEPGMGVAAQIEGLSSQLRLLPCVVMSDMPTDEEALVAFASGARGYCNTHAASPLLVQIAAVVLQGGLWIGESLMQRLVGATSRFQAPTLPDSPFASPRNDWMSSLTERERQVAQTIARGASNKEVARILGITERTVKAHVGAVFDKLGVRDRLQLSLLINGRRS